MSDTVARKSISHILPKLNRNEEEDSWEALETKPVAEGAQALRWLVWVSSRFLHFFFVLYEGKVPSNLFSYSMNYDYYAH